MKKSILFIFIIPFLVVACSDEESSKQTERQVIEEVQTLDSLNAELEQSIQQIDKSEAELKQALDNLND